MLPNEASDPSEEMLSLEAELRKEPKKEFLKLWDNRILPIKVELIQEGWDLNFYRVIGEVTRMETKKAMLGQGEVFSSYSRPVFSSIVTQPR